MSRTSEAAKSTSRRGSGNSQAAVTRNSAKAGSTPATVARKSRSRTPKVLPEPTDTEREMLVTLTVQIPHYGKASQVPRLLGEGQKFLKHKLGDEISISRFSHRDRRKGEALRYVELPEVPD